MLNRLFPLAANRNIALFYVLTAVINSWFVAAVWFFIWGAFMTNQQIGLSDTMTFALGMLLELPSGAIADLIGRKRAIVFGMTVMVIANLMIGLSSSFWGITLWYGLWTIGFAFQSGTLEALAYDSLSKDQQAQWPKILAAASIVKRIATLVATALGGFLLATHFRLPYLAMAAVGIVGVIAALALQEKRMTHKHNLRELTTYTGQIKDGLRILGSKLVWPIALVSLAVVSVMFIYNWGLLRPLLAVGFGYDSITLPLLQAGTSLVVIGVVLWLPALQRRFGVTRLLFVCAALFGAVFASFYLPYQWVMGGLAAIAVAVLAEYIEQLFSVFINHHAKAEHRATTLSAVSLFSRLPYVLFGIYIGYLADQHRLPAFALAIGVVVLLACGIALYSYKRIKARAA